MSNNFRRNTVEPTPIPTPISDSLDEQEGSQNEDASKVLSEKRQAKIHPQTHFLVGVAMLLCGTFFLIAFISYLFSWWIDYDVLCQFKISDLLKADKSALNVFGGKIGGYASYFFMQQGFGVAAILIPVGVFLSGLHMLGIKHFSLFKLFIKGVFFLLFTSILLGSIPFFYDNMFSILGGEVGYQTALYLKSILGNLGLYIILSFALICFLVLSSLIKPIQKRRERKDLEEQLSSELNEGKEASLKSSYISPKNNLCDELEMYTKEQSDTISDSFSCSEPPSPLASDVVEQTPLDVKPPVEQKKSPKEDKNDDVLFTIEEAPKAQQTPIENCAPKPTHFGIDTKYDPRLDLADYKFPTLDLLENFGDQSAKVQVQNEELLSNKKRIVETLQNYGIDISQIKATIGPTVTLYEIVPAAGVRISKIKNLEDDIALSLSALGIRIIAPIPGKGTIGIEVPNQNKQIVPMRDMLCSEKFTNDSFDLPIALGKTISNEPYVTDLSKMPHLLVAGATGQGKSVGLNAIIASLLYKKHPAELKFVMVDPKKVELSLFNKIERHYLAKLPDTEDAIITDTRKVVRTLNSLCIEMDNRYDLLKNAEVKNIKEYNRKFVSRRLNPEEGHRFLPYIVLIIDEFADLIMTAGKEIEMPIARLAQLARAIGIHLVIATQRPSVNIITGTIKANFPARIAFKVSSKIDSRTILDGPGADQLIGRGDMLLSTGNETVRLQCAYIDTPEIERITDFIGSQRAYPYAYELPDCPEEGQESSRSELSQSDRDSLFADVARYVISSQQGSTSSIQRKFKLGYNRAGRIIDQLEDAGVVGPLDRNTREVRIKDPMALEALLQAENIQ